MALSTVEPNCEERKQSHSTKKTSNRTRDRPNTSSRSKETTPGTRDEHRDPTHNVDGTSNKHRVSKELPKRSSSLKQNRRSEPKLRDGVVKPESVRVSPSDSTDDSLSSGIQAEASRDLPHASRQNSKKKLLPRKLEDYTNTLLAGVESTESFRLSRREGSHKRLVENAKAESFPLSRKDGDLEARGSADRRSSPPRDAYQKHTRESEGHKRRSSGKKKEAGSPSKQTPHRSDEPHHHRRHRRHSSTDLRAADTNDDKAGRTRRPIHKDSSGQEANHGHHRHEGHTTPHHTKPAGGARHTSSKPQASLESPTGGHPQKNTHSSRLGHEPTHSHPKRDSFRSKGNPDAMERPRHSQVSLAGHLDDNARRPRRGGKSSGVSVKSARSANRCHQRPHGERAPDEALVEEPTSVHHIAGEQEALRIEKLHLKGGNEIIVAGYAQYSLAEFIEKHQPGAIDVVNKTWRMIREISNYDEVAGVLVFTHLFEANPLAKTLFGFERDMDCMCYEVRKSPAFVHHARGVINMIEKTLDMLADLGPKSVQLPGLLHDIGKKHSRMGVEESMLITMGSALVESMREMLGSRRFTTEMEKAFLTVYCILTAEILNGMSADKLVSCSWANLKLVDDYKTKSGLLVFQHLFQNCPETKKVFGFDQDTDLDETTLKKLLQFRRHSAFLIMMLDKAIDSKETPDFHEYLTKAGMKHVELGIKAEHFIQMGNGLFHALEVLLEKKFDDKSRDAWLIAYGKLSSCIISAMAKTSAGDAPANPLGQTETNTSRNPRTRKSGVLKKTAQIATKSAGKLIEAFSSLAKNAEESSAVSNRASYRKGKEKLQGTGTHDFMVDREYDLVKFREGAVQASALADVTMCWDTVKATPNYAEKAGLLLFTYLFELCPMAKHVFGFPPNVDLQPDELKKNPFFLEHSSSLIKVIEEALNMLVSAGPESSQLSVVLHDLGKKHSRMAVDESMFTMMGKSLIETMRGMIGHKKFSNAMEKSWEVVFNVLAAEMIRGMNTDKIVLSTWAKLKTIEEWQQKAGLLLYQHMFEHCPETKIVFGFPVDLDMDTKALKSNPAFRMHSEYFMMMVDKAMGMMEAQTFNEHMSLLGLKHVGLGVAPEHFAYMGEALFHALETLLQDHFDQKTREAWMDVYGRMSSQLMVAMQL